MKGILPLSTVRTLKLEVNCVAIGSGVTHLYTMDGLASY